MQWPNIDRLIVEILSYVEPKAPKTADLKPIPEEDLPQLKLWLGQLNGPIPESRKTADQQLSAKIQYYSLNGIDTTTLQGEYHLRRKGLPYLRPRVH